MMLFAIFMQALQSPLFGRASPCPGASQSPPSPAIATRTLGASMSCSRCSRWPALPLLRRRLSSLAPSSASSASSSSWGTRSHSRRAWPFAAPPKTPAKSRGEDRAGRRGDACGGVGGGEAMSKRTRLAVRGVRGCPGSGGRESEEWRCCDGDRLDGCGEGCGDAEEDGAGEAERTSGACDGTAGDGSRVGKGSAASRAWDSDASWARGGAWAEPFWKGDCGGIMAGPLPDETHSRDDNEKDAKKN